MAFDALQWVFNEKGVLKIYIEKYIIKRKYSKGDFFFAFTVS